MSQLVSGVRAELRKAVHPVVIVVAVLFVFMAQSDARSVTGLWAVQADASAFVESQYDGPCVDEPGFSCETRQAEFELNRPLFENSELSGAQAAALSTPGGAISFATLRTAAGLGWLAIALIATVMVTGERHVGSASVSVLAAGGRVRLIGLKALALTALMVLLGAVTALVVWATQRVFAPTVALSDPPAPEVPDRVMIPIEPWPSWVHWTDVSGRVLVTLAIVGVAAVVACTVAALFTNIATAAAAFSAAYLFALFVAGNVEEYWLTPVRAVNAVLGLDEVGPRMSVAPVWSSTIAGFDDLYTLRTDIGVPVGQSLAWLGIAAAIAGLAGWWVRRSPTGLG